MANNDHKGATDHRDTYDSFMSITKWAIILIVAILVMLAILFV
jgi:uncharacterized membrane protein affecting hemolysin expression